MIAIAVRRFDEDDIRVYRWRRIGEHRTLVPSEIASEQDRSPAAQPHEDERRTEQVTSGKHLDGNARRDLDLALVADGLQVCQRGKRVALGVERQRRFV